MPQQTPTTSTKSFQERQLLHTTIIQDKSHPAYQENDKQMTVKELKIMYASLH